MAKATLKSASSPSPPKTTSTTIQPGTLELATIVDLSAVQVHYFPAALRRRRSLRVTRRVTYKAAASIPPVHSELVDSERIQMKMTLKFVSSNQLMRVNADVDDEPRVVDPKAKKLRIAGPKLKTDKVIDPLDLNTRRLRILADVCHDHLLALVDVPSRSDKRLRKS